MLLLILLIVLLQLADCGTLFQDGDQQNGGLRYGDMILTPHQKLLLELPKNVRMKFFLKDGLNRRWPDSIVPYTISDKYTDKEKQNIRDALHEIQQKTCFKFIDKTSEHKDWVAYEPREDTGCQSNLGRIGGEQQINLIGWCLDKETIQHETMHSLGVGHEHQRPDRDNYVDMVYENMDKSSDWMIRTQMDKIDLGDRYETANLPYDIHSIMHYHGRTLGKLDKSLTNQFVTMKIKGTNKPVPVNKRLSVGDVKKLRVLGNCPNANEEYVEEEDKGKKKNNGKENGKKKAKKSNEKKKSNKKAKKAKSHKKRILVH